MRSYSRIPNIRQFASDYKAQLNRPLLTEYLSEVEEKPNYVYFVSSLWKKELKTNTFRANFIRVLKNQKRINFEGGFAPRNKNDISGYDDLIIRKREKMEMYLLKTKQSLLSFNTPAVLDCHGWKLAEFLALGKVIISTPLSRKLPSYLVDNKHILFTDGSVNSITEKINYVLENPEIKKKIENESFQYYKKFLAPDKVIMQIFDNLMIKNLKTHA